MSGSKIPSGILPGIARSRWLHFFHIHGYQVKENTWTSDFVGNLKSVAYSNCVVDFIPITTIIDAQGYHNYAIQQP